MDSYILNTSIIQCPINQNISPICPPKTDPSILDQTWCDGDGQTAIIRCDDESQLIEIVCAFYGIDATITCASSIPNPTNQPKCYFNSSSDLVYSMCNQKNSCVIEDFPTTFDDACYGLKKALYVQWRCI